MRKLPPKSTNMGYLISKMADGRVWSKGEACIALGNQRSAAATCFNIYYYGYAEKVEGGYILTKEALAQCPDQREFSPQYPYRNYKRLVANDKTLKEVIFP